MRKNQFFPSLAAVAVSLSLSRPLDLDQNKKKTQSTPFKIAVLLKTYPWTGLESLACEIKPIHLALQRPPRDLEGSPRTRGVAASLFSHVFFLRGQNGVLREKESLSLSLSFIIPPPPLPPQVRAHIFFSPRVELEIENVEKKNHFTAKKQDETTRNESLIFAVSLFSDDSDERFLSAIVYS